MEARVERHADALLSQQAADHERVALGDADRVLEDELVEAAGDGAEVEVAEGLAHGVGPDLFERGHDGRDVGAAREEAEVDKVARHADVVLVHRVHDRVDQDLHAGLIFLMLSCSARAARCALYSSLHAPAADTWRAERMAVRTELPRHGRRLSKNRMVRASVCQHHTCARSGDNIQDREGQGAPACCTG